jgi:hypothetical protein
VAATFSFALAGPAPAQGNNEVRKCFPHFFSILNMVTDAKKSLLCRPRGTLLPPEKNFNNLNPIFYIFPCTSAASRDEMHSAHGTEKVFPAFFSLSCSPG